MNNIDAAALSAAATTTTFLLQLRAKKYVESALFNKIIRRVL